MSILSVVLVLSLAASPQPGRTATGTVVDGAGRPVAEAEVTLVSVPAGGGFNPEKPEPRYTGKTGPDGAFALPDLPPGMFKLVIERAGFVTLRQEGIEIPERRGKAALGRFQLNPGSLQGQVFDSAGRPLAGVKVWTAPGRENPVASPKFSPEPATDRDGRFSTGSLDPEGEVWLCAEGYRPSGFWLLQRPDLSRVTLERVGSLVPAPVRVTDPDGKPVAGAEVISGNMGGCVIIFSPWEGTPCGEGPVRLQGTTGKDGRATLVFDTGRERTDLLVRAKGFPDWKKDSLAISDGGFDVVLEPGAVLTGRVLALDGTPAAGAKVWGHTESTITLPTVTGADGSFRLERLLPGRRDLKVTHPELGSAHRRLQLALGENHLELKLNGRNNRIEGRVTGPGGEPVEGAEIQTFFAPVVHSGRDGSFRLDFEPIPIETEPKIKVLKKGYSPAILSLDRSSIPRSLEIRLEPAISLVGRITGVEAENLPQVNLWAQKNGDDLYRPGLVNREGVYRIEDLGPGEWIVRATLGREAKERIVLEPGDGQVELDLAIPPDFEVRGRVVDPLGEPVHAGLQFNRTGEEFPQSFSTLEDGTFSFRLQQGTYSVTAQSQGFRPTRLDAPLVVDADLDGLEIPLRQGIELRGRILAKSPEDPVQLRATQDGVVAHGEVSPDGSFVFPNLGPGTWEVNASSWEVIAQRNATVKVRISAGTPSPWLDLDLGLGSFTLSGRLESGDEPINVTLTLTRADGVSAQRMSLVDETFQIPRLGPGTWLLEISDHLRGRKIQRPVDLTATDQELVIDLTTEEP
jgi:hypothetical protein